MDLEKIERAVPDDLLEDVKKAFCQMVQNGERVALVLSEEVPPLIVDWRNDGVGLRTLQAKAAENKRAPEFVQQILEDCSVRSVDGTMIKKTLSAPPSTRFVIAPKDATAEVEIDNEAMRATVKWELLFSEQSDFSESERVDQRSFFSIPSTGGENGYTIKGATLPAEAGEDTSIKLGNNVVLKDDSKILAAIAGRPLFEKGKISVRKVLELPGDVDSSSGNIEFQ